MGSLYACLDNMIPYNGTEGVPFFFLGGGGEGVVNSATRGSGLKV